MSVDATVANQLDAAFATQIKDMASGAQFLTELHRGGLLQDGRSIGAAISSNLLQANIPEQGMNLKYADVTPRSPGQAQEATPPAGK